MKKHFTDDLELRQAILERLKNNGGYCPCVVQSYGKPQYKCLCENFRLHTPVGEACHCGLYIKDTD